MYVRITYPKIQALDNNGDLAIGYKIYTCVAGTSTLTASYSDRNLTVANTNPVILDTRGEADIYTGIPLKLIFTEPTGDVGAPIWTVDYVGEQVETNVKGTAVSPTLNNNYVVNTIPATSALSNNLELIMTPDVDNTDTITSVVFAGSGPNDLVVSGPYIGSTSGSTFSIQIDSVGATDTFKWRKDGGAWTDLIPITSLTQSLIEGVTATFSVTTGHVLNDMWTVTVTTPARVNLDSLGNLIVYKNEGGSIVAIDGGDMQAGYPAVLVLNESLNGWLLINPATPVFSQTTITAIRFRKTITSGPYSVTFADQGYELSCAGTFQINLPLAADFASRFVYVTNAGGGVITVQAAGAELVYNWQGVFASGLNSFLLRSGSIQLESNGVDWHILTDAGVEPPGVIKQYGSNTPPTGYLLCNGAAISRTTYSRLFAVIGTNYGAGDGATTFNIPDFSSARVVVGGSVGSTGGATIHNHQTLTLDHTHNTTISYAVDPQSMGAIAAAAPGTYTSSGSSLGTHWNTSSNTSSYPPYQTARFIIKY